MSINKLVLNDIGEPNYYVLYFISLFLSFYI